MKNRTCGSLALEYAILIAIVIGVLLTMSNYIRRSLQSKWRGVGDQFGYGRQYETGATESYNFTNTDIGDWNTTHPNWSAPY
ncbi:MAG: hypothetical protein ABSB18_08075 [Candidatus Omnitrophota bacterium]